MVNPLMFTALACRVAPRGFPKDGWLPGSSPRGRHPRRADHFDHSNVGGGGESIGGKPFSRQNHLAEVVRSKPSRCIYGEHATYPPILAFLGLFAYRPYPIVPNYTSWSLRGTMPSQGSKDKEFIEVASSPSPSRALCPRTPPNSQLLLVAPPPFNHWRAIIWPHTHYVRLCCSPANPPPRTHLDEHN